MPGFEMLGLTGYLNKRDFVSVAWRSSMSNDYGPTFRVPCCLALEHNACTLNLAGKAAKLHKCRTSNEFSPDTD